MVVLTLGAVVFFGVVVVVVVVTTETVLLAVLGEGESVVVGEAVLVGEGEAAAAEPTAIVASSTDRRILPKRGSLAELRPVAMMLVLNEILEEPSLRGLNLMVAMLPVPLLPPESGEAAKANLILPLLTTGEAKILGRKSPIVTVGWEIIVGS